MQSLIKEILEYRSLNFYNNYLHRVVSIEKAVEMHLWAKWKILKDQYKAGD